MEEGIPEEEEEECSDDQGQNLSSGTPTGTPRLQLNDTDQGKIHKKIFNGFHLNCIKFSVHIYFVMYVNNLP